MKRSGLLNCSIIIGVFLIVCSSFALAAEEVTINGRALTEQQITAFEELYGAKPLPGNYWYDPISGLYGVVGFPAFGFMYPGHDFGPLAQNASKGDTEVIIN